MLWSTVPESVHIIMVTIKITGVTHAAITEKTTVRPFQSDRVSATSFAVTAAAETAIKSLLPHFLSRYSSDASGFISFHHSPPHMKQALLIEVSLSFLFLYKLISMFDCVLQKLGFKPCRFVPLPDYIGIMVRGNSK